MTNPTAITAMPVRTHLGKKRLLIRTWSLQPEIMTLPCAAPGNGYPITEVYRGVHAPLDLDVSAQ